MKQPKDRSIIRARIRDALEEYYKTDDIFVLCRSMIQIGDISINCSSHAGIAYDELIRLKNLVPEYIPNEQHKKYIKAKGNKK